MKRILALQSLLVAALIMIAMSVFAGQVGQIQDIRGKAKVFQNESV